MSSGRRAGRKEQADARAQFSRVCNTHIGAQHLLRFSSNAAGPATGRRLTWGLKHKGDGVAVVLALHGDGVVVASAFQDLGQVGQLHTWGERESESEKRAKQEARDEGERAGRPVAAARKAAAHPPASAAGSSTPAPQRPPSLTHADVAVAAVMLEAVCAQGQGHQADMARVHGLQAEAAVVAVEVGILDEVLDGLHHLQQEWGTAASIRHPI